MVDKDLMHELDAIFGEVEATDGIFENLKDGEYLCEIHGAEYKESKAGRPMVQITCKVIHGEHKGKWHSRFMMLDGRDDTAVRRNLNMLATQARALGVDTSKGFQQTLAALENLEDLEVIVKIQTVKANNGNEYTNTFIRLAED